MLKIQRRLSLLLSIVLLCMPIMASTMPIRQLATETGGTLNYYKQDGNEYVEFNLDGIKLVLNITNGDIKDSFGRVVTGLNISVNNGTTYVSSEEILAIVKENKDTKVAINSFLKSLANSVINVLYSLADSTTNNKQTITAINANSSNSGNSSVTTPSAYELEDVHIRTMWVAPAKTTDSMLDVIGQITTPGALNANQYVWLSYEVKINSSVYESFDTELWIDGIKCDERHDAGNWGASSNSWMFFYLVESKDLKIGSIVELRSKLWENYKFNITELECQKSLKNNIDYIERSNETAEQIVQWIYKKKKSE